MGSQLLPIEQGCNLRLPRHSLRHVCRLCHTGILGGERHMLLDIPALAGHREELSFLVTDFPDVTAKLG